MAAARNAKGIRSMRLRRLTAALALSALALSGCSGDTNGDGTSTTSSVKPTVIDPTGSSSPTSESPTSSSASSTTEAAPDGPPEEAKANTKEGAEAFAKWYYEQVGKAWVSADSKTISNFANESCKACQGFVTKVDENRQKGWKADRNPYTVSIEKSIDDPDKDVRVVSLDVAEQQYTYTGEAGDKHPVAIKEPRYSIVVTTRWKDGEWRTDHMAMVR